jgi:lysophospholipase L1-like esterase
VFLIYTYYKFIYGGIFMFRKTFLGVIILSLLLIFILKGEDIMAITDYNDPLVITWYVDDEGSKISLLRTNQTYVIINNKIILSEIPSMFEKINTMTIGETTLYESKIGTLVSTNNFVCNYTLGEITVNSSYNGQTAVIPSWNARGVIKYPASRLTIEDIDGYYTSNNAEDAFAEIYERVSTIVAEGQTNSEVSDARPSINGESNTVLKDRLDKIENLNQVTSISANTVLTLAQRGIIEVTTAATPVTITLPSAVTTRVKYVIKKVDSGVGDVIVACNGVQTIDGVTTITLSLQYDSLEVVSNGTNWNIVSRDDRVATHLTESIQQFSDINDDILDLQTNKVDKVEGKGLSTNDYNNTEKVEVAKVVLKADITYVDAEVAAVASGSPKGVYATVVALEAAHPTGDTGVYLVTADGKWYYWNGSAWTDGGTYQSTGIADGSITEEMFDAEISTDFANVQREYIEKTESVGYNPDTSFDQNSGVGNTRIVGTSSTIRGRLTQIRIRVDAAGTGNFKVFSKNIDDTYNLVSEFSASLEAGLNTLVASSHFPETDVDKNYYFGYYDNSSAAVIKYKTANASFYVTGNATGNNITFTSSVDLSYAMDFTIESGDIKSRIEDNITDVSTLKTNVGIQTYVAGQTLTAITGYATVGNTRIAGLDCACGAGTVDKIIANVDIAGAVKIKFFSPNNGKYDVTDLALTAIAGENIWYAGVDFDSFTVIDGTLIGFYSAVTGIAYQTQATPMAYSIYNTELTGTGISLLANNANLTHALRAELVNESLLNKVSALEDKDLLNSYKKINNIYKTNFPGVSLPADWVQNGGFTVNNALISPVSGGWNVYAYLNKQITLDQDAVKAIVAINDVTSVFALARLSTNSRGTIAEFDCANKKINFYNPVTEIGDTPSGIVASKDISFDFVQDREYILNLKKNAETITASIIDTVTQNETEFVYCITGKNTTGKCWDSPGIIFRSGEIAVKSIYYYSPLPREPRTLILGDSIAEGDSLRLELNGGSDKRWVGLTYSALSGNVSISGRAGETSTGLVEKIQLVQNKLNPDFVILAIGTNDLVYATWLSNIQSLISTFEAKGAEIVLTTLPPRSDRVALLAQINSYILSSGYKYVDFAKALTTNGDRVTENTSLFLSDHVHPNVAGHLRMYEQLRKDVPEMF